MSRPVAYRVSLAVIGTANLVSNSDVPFRVSSGQVNFGCEESKTVSAAFQLPQNSSFVGTPIPRWDNFSNSSSRQGGVTITDGRAIATGSIRGLDYQSFPFGIRNCPGGGHAELLVEGTYRVSTTRTEPRQVSIVSNLSSLTPGAVRVTLPTEAELAINLVRVLIAEEGNSAGLSETVELTPQTRSATALAGKVRATLKVEQREVVLERPSSSPSAGA